MSGFILTKKINNKIRAIDRNIADLNDQKQFYHEFLELYSNLNKTTISNLLDLKRKYMVFAALYGCIEIIKFIIEKFPEGDNDIDIITDALFNAIDSNHMDIVKYLIRMNPKLEFDKDDGLDIVFTAIENGNLEIVKYLVSVKKIDFNKSYGPGKTTALHEASLHGHLNIVKYLVEECSCDVNAKNDYGETPMFLAIENCNVEVIKYLVEECHCDVNVKNKDGEAPIFGALLYGGNDRINRHISYSEILDTIKYLVEKCNYDINTKDKEGYTILDDIIGLPYGCVGNITKYLLEHGAKKA